MEGADIEKHVPAGIPAEDRRRADQGAAGRNRSHGHGAGARTGSDGGAAEEAASGRASRPSAKRPGTPGGNPREPIHPRDDIQRLPAWRLGLEPPMVSIEIKGETPEDVASVIRGLAASSRDTSDGIVGSIEGCGARYAEFIREAFGISPADGATRDTGEE